jgi:hypothetical protein
MIAYVFLPVIVGYIVGQATKRNVRWMNFIVGEQPAPRAWDSLFLQGGSGYVRIKLKGAANGEGRWMAGWFGSASIKGQLRHSRIARYPEMQDLYLVQTLSCDEHSGELLLHNGEVIALNVGLLVRWEEVQYLTFEAAAGRTPDDA